MSNIQTFEHPEFGKITVATIDGKDKYFEATPCAVGLGFADPDDVILQHCFYFLKQRVPHPQKPNKTVEKTFFSEDDLYRLIARSCLPEAEKFKRWMFDEVLPSLRGTSGNVVTPKTIDSILAGYGKAMKLIERQQETIAQKRALLQEAAHKIAFYDTFMRRNILTHFQELENVLRRNSIDIGQNRLVQDFRKTGDIHKGRTLFTQRAIDRDIGQNIQTGTFELHGAVFIPLRAFLHYKGVCAVFDRYKLTRAQREAVFRDLTANDEPLAKTGNRHSVGKCCGTQSQCQTSEV